MDNRYINGALGATGTMHYSQCLWHAVPPDLDVVMIEFAVNEGNNPGCDASMELIVRRLQLKAPGAALMIINWHDRRASG